MKALQRYFEGLIRRRRHRRRGHAGYRTTDVFYGITFFNRRPLLAGTLAAGAVTLLTWWLTAVKG